MILEKLKSLFSCDFVSGQAEHRGWGTAVDASPAHSGEGFPCQSQGEWANGGPLKSESDARQPVAATDSPAASPLPVKEEPADFEAACIKWEVCDDGPPQDGGGARPRPQSAAASTWPRDGAPPGDGGENYSFGFPLLPRARTGLPASCQKSMCSVGLVLEMSRLLPVNF